MTRLVVLLVVVALHFLMPPRADAVPARCHGTYSGNGPFEGWATCSIGGEDYQCVVSYHGVDGDRSYGSIIWCSGMPGPLGREERRLELCQRSPALCEGGPAGGPAPTKPPVPPQCTPPQMPQPDGSCACPPATGLLALGYSPDQCGGDGGDGGKGGSGGGNPSPTRSTAESPAAGTCMTFGARLLSNERSTHAGLFTAVGAPFTAARFIAGMSVSSAMAAQSGMLGPMQAVDYVGRQVLSSPLGRTPLTNATLVGASAFVQAAPEAALVGAASFGAGLLAFEAGVFVGSFAEATYYYATCR